MHASGSIVLSDSESVARFGDKLIVKPKFVVDYIQHLEVMEFKKKKRLKERARETREARGKSYEDYHWVYLSEDAAKLKKLRVLELNKYLKHHGTINAASEEQQELQSKDNYWTLLANEYSQNWSSRSGRQH